MNEESIEKMLRALPRKKPSEGLRERIFGSAIEEATPERIVTVPFRQRLAWAAAVVLGAGSLFWMLRSPVGAPDTTAPVVLNFEASNGNGLFDMSLPEEDAWGGSLTMTVIP